MSDFHSDLKHTSFFKSPADAVADLYEQYVHDLGNILDRHTFISILTNKGSAHLSQKIASAAFKKLNRCLHEETEEQVESMFSN